MTQRTCDVGGCDRAHRAKGYCAAHYNAILKPDRHRTVIVCAECGEVYETKRTNGRYCSLTCRDAATAPERERRAAEARAAKAARAAARAASRPDPRSPLRIALETDDRQGVIDAIRRDSTPNDAGCWEWARKLDRSGYPVIRIGNRGFYVHRLALEAKLGKPLGKQPAHHMCANSKCVNPAHLQPVSHRENSAEMLARVYLLGRIADLEAALGSLDPAHPLLREVGAPTPA